MKNPRVIIPGILAATACFTWWVLQHNPPVSRSHGETPPHAASTAITASTTTPTPEEIIATTNARPCDATVLTDLDLSRPPTEAELIAAGNLGEKLTPTRSADPDKLTDPAARRKQQLDNLSFGTAIQAWNQHRYDEALKLFEDHLQSSANSPWAAECMLHIGCHHQYLARFNESAEWFDKILATAPAGSEMYHKAKLRRSIINIDLGRLDEATTAFAEMIQNDPDPNHQSYASYWLTQIEFLKKNETALRDCGQKALSHAAGILGLPEAAADLFQQSAAGSHGYNASELYATALEHGLDPSPVRADAALDALPVPFIAHYTDRHYVTVESVSTDTVRLYDSRISASTEMPRRSFEKSWSGFALLLKPAPSDPGINPAENLEQIIGGCCGQPTQVSDLGKDPCEKSNCGLPGYSVNPINMNFKVSDTPMWWDSPAGPPVYISLLFNSQDSLNNFEPFGEKWSFEYVSYLLITPGERVQVKDGDGKLQTFPAPVGGIPTPVVYPVTYQSPPGDFRVLTQTALHDFILTEQDGTQYTYGIPAAMSGTASVPLLLSITDRHNNTLGITHNANGSITALSHSTLPGQSWDFVYTAIGTASRVIRINDPFNRSCTFGYDSHARLTSQTDMGGIHYSYTYTTKDTIDNTINYSGQTAAPQLFVSSINTPTGTTRIETEPADGFNTTNAVYTAARIAEGYQYSYPPHDITPENQKMWTNYRITVRDHQNNPTEYYFCGFDSKRYRRDPIQMQRSSGLVRPEQGARTEYLSQLVGGKGVIYQTTLYSSQYNIATTSNNYDYSSTTRLPSSVDDSHGGHHYIQYNTQGRPTLVKLHNSTDTDQHITTTYMSNGIDVDTVTRNFNGVSKTLADYGYYSNRDIQSVTDVTGRTISYQWTAKGQPDTVTDSATGDIIGFTYDTNSRPDTVTLNSTVIATTAYDINGNLLVTQSADGRTMHYEYDSLNRLTRELRPDNTFTAYQWACCFIEATRSGKIVGTTETTLRKTLTFHDNRAFPRLTVDTDGSTTKYEFDIAGRMVNLTDANSQITRWNYNAAGQLMEKIYPDTSNESFLYNTYGQVETYTNRRNQATVLHYESDGLLDKIDKPNGEPDIDFDYDTWRRIWTISQDSSPSTSGGTHTFGHDLLGRPTSINGPWSDDTISYTYNAATRSVTRTTPGSITQTTTANAIGQVASVTNPLGTFTHIFDGLGGLLTDIIHTGANAGFNTAFTYHGDAFDRALETLTSTKPGGATIAKHSYSYNTLGNIDTWKREAPLPNPSGPTRQFESKVFYNPADQVSSLIHTPITGSSVAETAHHYTYDFARNITSKQVETTATGATMTSYETNNLNQLTAIGGPDGVNTVIVRGNTNEPASVKVKPATSGTWQNARMLSGNRFESDLNLADGPNEIDIQAKDGSNNTSNYTYALDLTASSEANIPSYDADGNLLTDGVRSYEWDSQSRLIKITWGDGSDKTTEYKYNVLGQRSETLEKSGTTTTAHYYYLYEGLHLVTRYTGAAAANIDRRYYSQGERRWLGSYWQTYYYARDHLGSIREVVYNNGTLAARYDYDPYGKRTAQYQAYAYTGGCDLGYTGHITQPSPVTGQTELVLTHFRAYDPDLGRWLSADPIGEAGGLNLYGYVGGNPINEIDPVGLDAVFCVGRNKKNPDFFTEKVNFAAKDYEKMHPGKKAHIFQTYNYADFSKALLTPNIDRLDYWGHSGDTGLFLGEPGSGVYLNNVNKLPKENISLTAEINLVGCSSAAGGESSIAQAFSNYFKVPTAGFSGPVSFGKWGVILTRLPRGKAQTRTPGQTGDGTSTSTWPFGL